MGLLTGKDSPRFSQYTADQYFGDGSTVAFTLSRTPVSPASIFVTIDGVKQHSTTYSVTTNQIVFSEAPPNGTSIECINIGSQGTTSIIPDSSVTTEKLVADSVTTVKILDKNVTTSKIADGSITPIKLDTVSGTGVGASSIPIGTTAQRPSGVVGVSRYNTSLGREEVYNSSGGWNPQGSILQTIYSGSRANGRIAYSGGAAATFYDQTACPNAITTVSGNSKLLWFISITGSCDITHVGVTAQYNVNGGGWNDCQAYDGNVTSGVFTLTWQSNANNTATAGTYAVIPKGAYSAGSTIDFRLKMYSPQSYEAYLGGSDSDWAAMRYSRGQHIIIETID